MVASIFLARSLKTAIEKEFDYLESEISKISNETKEDRISVRKNLVEQSCN